MSSASTALDVWFYLLGDMLPSHFLVKTFHSAACCSSVGQHRGHAAFIIIIFHFYHGRLRISLQDDPPDCGSPGSFSASGKIPSLST